MPRRRLTATRRARSLRRRHRSVQRGGALGLQDWGTQVLALLKDRSATTADPAKINLSELVRPELNLETIKNDSNFKIELPGNPNRVHLYDLAAELAPILDGINTIEQYRAAVELGKTDEDYKYTFDFVRTAEGKLRGELLSGSQLNELVPLPAETSPVLLLILIANLPKEAMPRVPILDAPAS